MHAPASLPHTCRLVPHRTRLWIDHVLQFSLMQNVGIPEEILELAQQGVYLQPSNTSPYLQQDDASQDFASTMSTPSFVVDSSLHDDNPNSSTAQLVNSPLIKGNSNRSIQDLGRVSSIGCSGEICSTSPSPAMKKKHNLDHPLSTNDYWNYNIFGNYKNISPLQITILLISMILKVKLAIERLLW